MFCMLAAVGVRIQLELKTIDLLGRGSYDSVAPEARAPGLLRGGVKHMTAALRN
jgi:hypothetical protein